MEAIINFFYGHNIYLVGLLAGLFTWGMTALGAAVVLFFKDIKPKILDSMLGFAAGIMIAASIFSLIIPALDYSEVYNPNINSIVIVVVGFMLGVLLLLTLDKIIPHFHNRTKNQEGLNSNFRRSTLMIFAITLHNIPEGLAIGVAFGAFAQTQSIVLLGSAISLVIGIGLQNFPEGSAVSFPLYREGLSKRKSFFYGQLSAIVEPISIIIGIFLVTYIENVLALALSFAAGAMLFVVVEELIPESQANKENRDLVTLFTMIGFCLMMTLDVLLG